MKRRPGFSNADGFQDADEAVNIDGFDNCCGSGMNADGDPDDNFSDEFQFNANGEHDPVDGEYNANGERDEFVYNADGEYVGAEGEFNADGEHFDADGDEFQFNADGEFAGVDGEYNSNGDHIDGFDNFREPGFENAEGDDDDDNFSNARGKRQEKKAAKQEAKVAKKAAKTQAKVAKKAAKTEIKKAKAAAKVEKKTTKTAAKVAKKAAKVERKNTKVNARVALKAAKAAPVDLSAMMEPEVQPEVVEESYPEPVMERYANLPPESYQEEEVMEVETDPSMTNVEMVDEEGEPLVDMEEVDNFLEENSGVDGFDNMDDVADNFYNLSLPGAQRRKTRKAVKTAVKMGKAKAKIAKKTGKAEAKVAKKMAKADKKQSVADVRRTKADTKQMVKTTRAQYKGEAKVIAAPTRHKSVEAISKAASNIGIAAAASLGAASLGKSAAKAIAAKKAAGEELSEQELEQLAAAKAGLNAPEDGTTDAGAEDGSGDEIPKKGTKKAGIGGPVMWVTVGLIVLATAGYLMSQKGAKKAA